MLLDLFKKILHSLPNINNDLNIHLCKALSINTLDHGWEIMITSLRGAFLVGPAAGHPNQQLYIITTIIVGTGVGHGASEFQFALRSAIIAHSNFRQPSVDVRIIFGRDGRAMPVETAGEFGGKRLQIADWLATLPHLEAEVTDSRKIRVEDIKIYRALRAVITWHIPSWTARKMSSDRSNEGCAAAVVETEPC